MSNENFLLEQKSAEDLLCKLVHIFVVGHIHTQNNNCKWILISGAERRNLRSDNSKLRSGAPEPNGFCFPSCNEIPKIDVCIIAQKQWHDVFWLFSEGAFTKRNFESTAKDINKYNIVSLFNEYSLLRNLYSNDKQRKFPIAKNALEFS